MERDNDNLFESAMPTSARRYWGRTRKVQSDSHFHKPVSNPELPECNLLLHLICQYKYGLWNV